MPELEALERMIGQARRGDWVQDAFLRVLAADSLEKGEPLPPPLRHYIVTSLLGSHAESVATEYRELCLLVVRVLVSYLQPYVSRDEVEDTAVKAVERIRQVPDKFTHGRRLPESLQGLESCIVWVLFMVKQWEITSVNVDDARKLRSWQDAVEAVSERLDPDRESVDGKQGRLRSGYAPRNIANILRYFWSLGDRNRSPSCTAREPLDPDGHGHEHQEPRGRDEPEMHAGLDAHGPPRRAPGEEEDGV